MNVKVLMKDPLAEVGSERLRLETNLVNQERKLRWGYYHELKSSMKGKYEEMRHV